MAAANSLTALFYSGIALGKIHIFRRFFDSLEWQAEIEGDSDNWDGHPKGH